MQIAEGRAVNLAVRLEERHLAGERSMRVSKQKRAAQLRATERALLN